jgi:hypothetical protein
MRAPQLEHVDLKDLIVVGCWYLWWRRREMVKGVSIPTPSRSSFAISSLTPNYNAAKKNAFRKKNTMGKAEA